MIKVTLILFLQNSGEKVAFSFLIGIVFHVEAKKMCSVPFILSDRASIELAV